MSVAPARTGMRAALAGVIALCLVGLVVGAQQLWSSARFTASATSAENSVAAECAGSSFAARIAALNPIAWLRLGRDGAAANQAGPAWLQRGAIVNDRQGALFCADDGASYLGASTLTSGAQLPDKFSVNVWIRGGSGAAGTVWTLGGADAPLSVGVDSAGRVTATYQDATVKEPAVQPSPSAEESSSPAADSSVQVSGSSALAADQSATAPAIVEPSQDPAEPLTSVPSQEPTQESSPEPSQEPSPEPSQEPSQETSQEPSQEPSEEPSQEPTEVPSSPSASPAASEAGSQTPTAAPVPEASATAEVQPTPTASADASEPATRIVRLAGGQVGDGLWHMVSVTVTPTLIVIRVDGEVVTHGPAAKLGEAPVWTLGAESGGYRGYVDEFIVTAFVLNQDIMEAAESSV